MQGHKIGATGNASSYVGVTLACTAAAFYQMLAASLRFITSFACIVGQIFKIVAVIDNGARIQKVFRPTPRRFPNRQVSSRAGKAHLFLETLLDTSLLTHNGSRSFQFWIKLPACAVLFCSQSFSKIHPLIAVAIVIRRSCLK